MSIPIYHVDAFTSELFSGNPAAVCILQEWPGDELLQSVAAENNLSETAFLRKQPGGFDVRWFTPVTEVALCGHATLAGGYVVFNRLNWPEKTVHFHSRKSGLLTVKWTKELYEMDFPARPPTRSVISVKLNEALGRAPREAYESVEDLLVVVENENAVRNLKPDFDLLKKIEKRGVIVTAPGKESDFVSRYFAPAVGIPEDPVTGSSHCVLVPYWAKRLGKKRLHARQVSRRGGELYCEDNGPRVIIAGKAVLYSEGFITI